MEGHRVDDRPTTTPGLHHHCRLGVFGALGFVAASQVLDA